MGIIAKIFGTKNDRDIKAMRPRVAAINALEDRLKSLEDDQIQRRIIELKNEVQKALADDKRRWPGPSGNFENDQKRERDAVNAVLDPYLHETFALVREAGRRVLGMRHYDVQMIGGMTLHAGRISEMKT